MSLNAASPIVRCPAAESLAPATLPNALLAVVDQGFKNIKANGMYVPQTHHIREKAMKMPFVGEIGMLP
jgi:hypothetical protein